MPNTVSLNEPFRTDIVMGSLSLLISTLLVTLLVSLLLTVLISLLVTLFVTFSSVVFPNTTNGPPNNKYVSIAISVTIFMITRFLAIVMNLLRRFLRYFQ